MKADLAVVNGTIYTMEVGQPVVEAVAVANGRVAALGGDADVRPWVHPGTEVVDLRGQVAIPGLTDAHLHFVSYGLALGQVDLTSTRSQQEAAQRVEARVQSAPAGEWIRGRGWDRNLWSPSSFPRKEILDAVSPDNPVALSSKDGHSLWVNSLALERLRPVLGDGERWGAQIVCDEGRQEAIGILVEEAAGAALDSIGKPGPEALREAVQLAAKDALRLGVTGVHDCEEGEELAAFGALWHEGNLPLRVYMLLPRGDLQAAIALGLRTGIGDEWLRIGHLKLFADGALGSRTASMLAPYDSEPGNTGIEVLDTAELREIVERASRSGIAIATHAIGDRANREVLDAYAQTKPLWSTAGLRPRIEHVQLLAPSDLPRLAELGVIASMQPIHATSDWEMAEAYWGERSRGAYAWRSLLRSGAILAFGSDCPVETLDPLAGIHAAVTRQRPDGTPEGGWRPEERLTVQEALRAYTWGAAYASGEEAKKGSLAPGKVGDLVILAEDLFQVQPERIGQVRVQGTIVGGRPVYVAADSAVAW